jgi:hypothetical protein
MALNGHFLTHMPHPLQSVSDMTALFPSTLIASTRLRTIGQKLTQSWLHFLTLHLSVSNTAIRVMAKLRKRIQKIVININPKKTVQNGI